MKYFLFTVCLGLTKKENAFTTSQIAGVFSEMLDAHAYSRKIRVSRSPHTSLSPDESAAVQIHLEFNSTTRKHFCHIFIRKLRFSRYTAEKGKCIPAYLLIEQTRRGVQGGWEKGRKGGAGKGRKGSGRREKGGGRREKRRREKGEQEGGRKGEGEGRKGPPCTPLNKHIIRNGPTGDLTWEGFTLNNKLRKYDVIGAGVNNLGLKITFLDRKKTFWRIKSVFLMCLNNRMSEEQSGSMQIVNSFSSWLKKMWNGNSLVSGFCKRLVNLFVIF